METASSQSVLGDFNDAKFEYFGTTSRFYKHDGAYFVETPNAQGHLESFRISYTLGFYPLQQYLIAFPDGRIQALSISWDSRPKAAGGQRWYHLYPDEKISPSDPLHWTGAFQNWNSRCASCHTTNLAKNYSMETNRYSTTWAEMRVGCEACHGAGAKHLAWARGDRTVADQGLLTDVRKLWEPLDGHTAIPQNLNPAANRQLDVCAGCHSVRSELQQRDSAAGFDSNYSLALLREGLYHPDGQILGEVYEAGSFLQSRMYRNGVSCSNCHDPHSNALRVQGNGLCLQCHAASKYQSETHVFHKASSSGAQCVSCHMPSKIYMGVDRRRDHSFRVPDPAASVALGVPNACTECHTDRSPQWASDALAVRRVGQMPRYPFAAAFASARAGDESSVPPLLQIARDVSEPPIVRATALFESSRFPSAEQVAAAVAALRSADPLMRASAVESLGSAPPAPRLRYLRPLLRDPVKTVRMAIARHLADVRNEQVPIADRPQFTRLLQEYQQSLLFNADAPASMNELGLFHLARGNLPEAERALLQARKLVPTFLPAMLNLADVYRAQQSEDRAQAVLKEALAAYPNSREANYAMGLLYVRTGRKAEAVPLLRRAAQLSPADPQYVYAYAMALAETGKTDEARRVTQAALQRFPHFTPLQDAESALRKPD